MSRSEIAREVSHPDWPLVWRIYGSSFPATNSASRSINSSRWRLRFHCQLFYQGEQLLGFIFWWDCGEQIYIEHLAINPALRGQNHGSRLLAAFCETAGRGHPGDRPARGRIALRRLRFYQSLGFA
ncbi:GNAT family N-acetyltransferase [Aeromonas hydrophila]|uniref:GNAT family N-acetyltransferase n=1 Tax=Aeromonas hydrophila TaxID=644 RepID=A0A926FM68_AERHY|nr:GNAT family N-acetyltransferase [Aeromonas hydrophila]